EPALRVADEDHLALAVARRCCTRLCNLARIVTRAGAAADYDRSHIGTGRTQARGTGAERPGGFSDTLAERPGHQQDVQPLWIRRRHGRPGLRERFVREAPEPAIARCIVR